MNTPPRTVLTCGLALAGALALAAGCTSSADHVSTATSADTGLCIGPDNLLHPCNTSTGLGGQLSGRPATCDVVLEVSSCNAPHRKANSVSNSATAATENGAVLTACNEAERSARRNGCDLGPCCMQSCNLVADTPNLNDVKWSVAQQIVGNTCPSNLVMGLNDAWDDGSEPPPPPPDGCSPDSKQCIDGDNFEQCDADGNWSLPYSCSTSFPGTTCSAGYCVGSDDGGGGDGGGGGGGGCSDQCSPGSKQCIDGDQFQECGDFNGDGCNEWSGAYSCGASFPGTSCSGGYCVGGGDGGGGTQCSPGSKQCIDGDQFQQCDDSGNWSGAYSCGASWPGTSCSGGYCVGSDDGGGGDSGGGDSGGGASCGCSSDPDCWSSGSGDYCDGCSCQWY
jgi:hypothetical protein